MKLYATVASERAMKAQGGKELEIVVFNSNRSPSITIRVDTDINGKVRAGIFYDAERSHRPLVAEGLERCKECYQLDPSGQTDCPRHQK